jgi:hypothetical protein
MPGNSPPGPLGVTVTNAIDGGTTALTSSPAPGTIGASPAAAPEVTSPTATPTATETENDPDIEALNLRGKAKKGAYALKKAHPSVTFTSGRRDADEQASAMAYNIVKDNNRNWIKETYKQSTIRDACQKWVDDNTDKTTKDDIAAGLLSVFKEHTDDQVARISKHISGDAFDVQPVETDADAIKKSIRDLDGCEFLEKEGGLVRWHAQF